MHSRESIRAEIKRILVDVLELDLQPDQIRDDDPLFTTGLGVDSIEAMEILSTVEKRFSVKIPEDEIGFALFQDVSTIADAVEAQLGKAP